MRKALVAVAILFAVSAGSAQASTTIIAPEGSPFPYQRWIDESQVPTPDVTIEGVPASPGHGCPAREFDYQACTSPEEHKIWMEESSLDGAARQIFYHEIGHNFDADVMPEWARERFDAIYGFGGPWLEPGVEPEVMTAGEWFAEVFSECAVLA